MGVVGMVAAMTIGCLRGARDERRNSSLVDSSSDMSSSFSTP